MNKVSKERLLEFNAYTKYDRNYRLYVKGGKPIRIMCETASDTTTLYPEDNRFDTEWQIIIATFSKHENLRNLKKLYNVLEEGYWKKDVKKHIDELINYYEKGLAILKS